MSNVVTRDETAVAQRKRGWARPDLSEINRNRTRHGMTKSPEHKAWRQILARCNNKNATGFDNYGGRGIRVSQNWLTFEGFYADMGDRPSRAHSIERENTNGDYCKANCRWATRQEQSINTRKSRWWLVHGNRYPSSQSAALACGVDQATIVRWCNGYYQNGVYRSPKIGCSSTLKYGDK